MKKIVMSVTIIVLFIFLVGCIDYKPYDIPEEEVDTTSEEDLLNEIAQIEEELELEDTEDEEFLEGEDVLSDLEEEDGITGATTTEETNLTEEEEEITEVEEDIIIPDLDEEDTNTTEETDEEPETSSAYDYTIKVKENELVKLNVKVTDPDKDNVTSTFSAPINSSGLWQTNYGDAGEYVITLKATDGKSTTQKEILLVVERVNVPPTITTLKDITVKEGETIKLDPNVDDPNNDPVTVTISEPLKSGTFKTDHTSAGIYDIIVTASDGELETKVTFKLTIADVNVLPEIKGLKDIQVKEGETVEIKPVITDLDADDIVVTISEPVGNDGVWETSYTDHGIYEITVIADDGKDQVTETVKVTIDDINMPPDITDVYLDVN